MHKLVVDTNNWISALLGNQFRQRLWKMIDNDRVTLLLSHDLLKEIRKTTQKDYLQKNIASADVEKLIQDILLLGKMIDVHSTVQVCRDPKDNFLLALSQDGDADYLITGDDDLLAIGVFRKTKIITLSEFEKE